MVRFERGCDTSWKRSIKSFKAIFSFMVVYICLWLLWVSLKNRACFNFEVYCLLLFSSISSLWSRSHGTIVILVGASFVVVVVLSLLLLSWLWLLNTISIVGASFVVVISWHHHRRCWYFFHGHLVPLLMVLVFLLWSWSPNAIAIGASCRNPTLG